MVYPLPLRCSHDKAAIIGEVEDDKDSNCWVINDNDSDDDSINYEVSDILGNVLGLINQGSADIIP